MKEKDHIWLRRSTLNWPVHGLFIWDNGNIALGNHVTTKSTLIQMNVFHVYLYMKLVILQKVKLKIEIKV